MARKIFSESIKFYKKMVKNTYYVQFKGENAYISDGHFIAALPTWAYTMYILPNVAGFPYYNNADICYTGENGILKESTIDFEKMYVSDNNIKVPARATNMLFEDAKGTARAFLWESGETTGALVNDMYYKISLEYSNGEYLASAKNYPIFTKTEDRGFMVLPINYTSDSLFGEIISAYNRPAQVQAVA